MVWFQWTALTLQYWCEIILTVQVTGCAHITPLSFHDAYECTHIHVHDFCFLYHDSYPTKQSTKCLWCVRAQIEECYLSPPGQNGRRFSDGTCKCIFMNAKLCILIWISLKFVPKGQIDKKLMTNSFATMKQSTFHYLLLLWWNRLHGGYKCNAHFSKLNVTCL